MHHTAVLGAVLCINVVGPTAVLHVVPCQIRSSMIDTLLLKGCNRCFILLLNNFSLSTLAAVAGVLRLRGTV
jgi:hypothetical protein